ncbi:hypothetical protein RDABS01_036002 [Bienertia sinuspersici]
MILDNKSSQVRGIGRFVKGVYYLVTEPVSKITDRLARYVDSWKKERSVSVEQLSSNIEQDSLTDVNRNKAKKNMTQVWHQRLGHAPVERLKKIEELKGFHSSNAGDCIVCPLAKFTRLPFKLSKNRAKDNFELIHFDTWVPIKSTQGKDTSISSLLLMITAG